MSSSVIPTIEIQIRTNIPGELSYTTVTSSLFIRKDTALTASSKIPPAIKAKLPTTPVEEDMMKSTSKYPFFRSDVKFNEDMFTNDAFDFFFNQTSFVIGVVNASKVKKNEEAKTARANVMFMLKHLFSTSFPIEDNLETTFDVNIRKSSTHVGRHSLIPDFIADLFSMEHESHFTYLTLAATEYTVVGVTWMNDILNQSRYFQLFSELKKYVMKREEKKDFLEKKLKEELFPKFTLDLFKQVNDYIQELDINLKGISKFITTKKLNEVFGNKDEDVKKEVFHILASKEEELEAEYIDLK